MLTPRLSSLLIAAALCAGSIQAHGADDVGTRFDALAGAGKSFGRLDMSGKWLTHQRFGPSAAFLPSPLGQEITPPEPAAAPVAVPPPAPATTRAETRSPVAEPNETRPRRSVAAKRPVAVRAAVRKPKTNPMDSYARDNRRQAWPCKGDGICAWR